LVLDGNNCFDAYHVSQTLRQQNSQVKACLERIRVARAFTCYQMAAMIQEASARWLPQAGAEPVFVLDFLATFQDEDVLLPDRCKLLRSCLPDLRRLTQLAPVLVSTRPADPELMEILTGAADDVWSFAPDPEPPVLRLFPQ